MSKLNDIRADIICALYEAHIAGKIDWLFDSEARSAKARGLDDIQIHIDMTKSSLEPYKVWFFNDSIDVDSFNAKELREYTSPFGGSGDLEDLVGSMYADVKEKETVAAISPVLYKLKGLFSNE